MPELHVVTASVRPTRVGPRVAAWFVERARAHGGFEVVPVDLAEIALPLHDEPAHPRLARYEHEHTCAWSALVDRADAFVFVTPEYNYSAPPSLLNALNFLYREWAYKPAGFVSYGGVSGGLRSVQMSKTIETALRMMAVPEGVTIPFVSKRLPDPAGPFVGDEHLDRAAVAMLDELARWEEALRGLRRPRA
jgi:NAD(P)H-dependent FMN reductase